MEIVSIKIGDLKPYDKNAKKHDKTQIDNVAESIKQFGIVQPIVVDKDNVVIIGHCRLEACKKLKFKEVPCVLADTLTDEQVKELRLLDNKLNESEWDLDLISEELADLDLSDFELDWGIVQDDGFGTDFELPSGGKTPLQTMSITFSEEQAEFVNNAIKEMKRTDLYKDYKDEINENSNGNALYLIVMEWFNGR